MNSKEANKRIQALRKEIVRLRTLYHVDNARDVTDDVYDSLTQELRKLENAYPSLKDSTSSVNRVAGAVLAKFEKVPHASRMLSLNDAFSKEEVLDWQKRIKKLLPGKKDIEYFCELKLDGLAVSLIYEDGKFIRGATRGDGFIGEDITENLKTIENIPLVLPKPYPKYIEIRGEALLSKKVWERLNKENERLGKMLFANTRNAAAGSLRQLDPKLAQERSLEFFAWDIQGLTDTSYSLVTHSEKHLLLRKLGFTIDSHEKKTQKIEEVFAFIDVIEKIRPSYPYGTDGVVISVNALDQEETLGVVGKAPRWAIAYKYPAEKATTIVVDITVNVGRTGALTPLAHFKPTLVAGSTVSKATLHNIDQINRLDIRIGDTVVIQKAGDVIPEVVEVLVSFRTGKEKKFSMPQECPVCRATVERRQGGAETTVAYYCTNIHCPARNRRGMQHFVNVFEIYEVGPKVLDRLKTEGLISDAADLFTLTEADLSGLERFGEKSAKNIIDSITSRKKISLWRFLYALGILHVGEETAKDIANHFGSLEKIKSATSESINAIPNIGPIVSKSVHTYFQEKTNTRFIEKLFANGIRIEKSIKKQNGKFTGMTFVLTGTLPTLSRDVAKAKIENQGGKVSSSVSKNTSYVLAGESPGSKYTDAQKLGIQTLTEEAFMQLLQ
ncbi:NAD-dependent DNA ligase LigA [Candidatus Nomurabacteria bacterium]|jgi:DNA ligase (NAD+)|nr:MAG: NAD-dependent DNA ligase LigA [Candidatus Nomurabacteria bacterium]